MSKKGDCWDNAVAESFFKTLIKIKLNLSTKFRSIQNSYCYLFLITDVYSSKIVGHYLWKEMTAEAAVKALK